VFSSCQSEKSALTALRLIEADDHNGCLVVARTDRNLRERSLEIFDVLSQVSIQDISPTRHFHNQDIFQILYVEGSMLTVSADCLMNWSYINNFDINHRLRHKIDCCKPHTHFRPQKMGLIRLVCANQQYCCVLMGDSSIQILTLDNLEWLCSIPVAPFSVISNISLLENLLVVTCGSFQIDIFDVSDPQNVQIVGRFITTLGRLISSQLIREDTFILLYDDGRFDMVDVPSNKRIGSSKCLGGQGIAITNISLSSSIVVCAGNHSPVVEMLSLRGLAERNEDSCLPYFEGPQTESMQKTPSPHKPDRINRYINSLRLPLNKRCFEFLTRSNPDSVARNISIWKQALSHKKQTKKMERFILILSYLSCWNPLLLESKPAFPKMVFPFFKLFGRNLIFCVELLIFLISNWCSSWFPVKSEYNIGVVDEIETLLKELDIEVFDHLSAITTDAQVGVFIYERVCCNLLTEILPGGDWQKFLDMLISKFQETSKQGFDSNLLLKITLLALVSQRNHLLSISSEVEVAEWCSGNQPIDLEDIFNRIPSSSIDRKKKPFYIGENSNLYPDFPLVVD
jgi:hypothetical protein